MPGQLKGERLERRALLGDGGRGPRQIPCVRSHGTWRSLSSSPTLPAGVEVGAAFKTVHLQKVKREPTTSGYHPEENVLKSTYLLVPRVK